MSTPFDLSAFDFSSFVDRLAGPAGLKLSLALLHFLWQGVLIAAVAAALMRVLGRRSANRRYAIGVAGIALMAVAPVVTFCVVEPPEGLPAFAASDQLLSEVDRLEGLIASMESSLGDTDSATPEAEPTAPPLTWAERVRLLQPYALLVWLAGTGVFALRLGFGVRASRRFGRGRRPLPEAWVRIAAEVAARVGLKAPRIFLSDNVAEAVAVGLLRPMVLIPAAWLGRIPPEVLEAVLAHELAHLRRHDLWVNLLQRCVEAALFYHPAVWWLSRRVRVEREYCCDETAALAVTGRAAYARALEFVATEAVEARRRAARRPASWRPALAAGMGGEPMALLERVRRVLGAEGGPPRGNWMSEGLLALAVPAALWAGIATVGPAVASADEKEEELVEVSEDVIEVSEEETHEVSPGESGDVLIFRNEDVLIGREPGEEGADDVLILRDGEEGPFEVRLDTNGVPMLKDIPIVGRLFETTDLDVELRGDVLIARSEDAEEETEEVGEETEEEDDLREALRELRAEMKALRGEVEALRDGGERKVETKHFHEVRPLPAKPPGVPRPPKPPIPPGTLRLEEHVDGPGMSRMFLHKPGPDGKGLERFEVRVFREKGEGGEKGELGLGPEKIIKRLHVDHADGKPRVFLFREGKDGKPEKVEGKVEGDESVIETEGGRIHVRRLPPGAEHPPRLHDKPRGDALPRGIDSRDEIIRRLEEEVRRLRGQLKEGHGEAGEVREEAVRVEGERRLADLRKEEAERKDKLGEDHPEMQAVRRKIEVLRSEHSDVDLEGLAESLKELDLAPEKREAIERAVRERVEEAKARAEEARARAEESMRQAERLREAAERAGEAADAAREEAAAEAEETKRTQEAEAANAEAAEEAEEAAETSADEEGKEAEEQAEEKAGGEEAREETEKEFAAEARTLDALFARRVGRAFEAIRGGLKGLGLVAEPITAEVVAIKASETSRTEFVLVSAGMNSGLKKGDFLFLYRDADYLGKVQVTNVLKDQAVGRMIQRVRGAELQPGDAVTSRL